MCGEAKPLSEFFANKVCADGLQFHCKTCHREVQRQYRERHPERNKQSDARWRARNPEHARAIDAEKAARWRERNPQAAQETAERYKAKLRLATTIRKLKRKLDDAAVTEKTCNKCMLTKPLAEFHANKRSKYGVRADCKQCHAVIVKDVQARRYQRERDTVLAYNKARRSHIGTHTPQWGEMDKMRVVYRKAQELGMQVDHVVPLRHKLVCGLHCWWNLQLLTRSENSRKKNRAWPDMP